LNTAHGLRTAPADNSQKFNLVLQDLKHLLDREKTHLLQGGVDKLESFAKEKMQMFASLSNLAKMIDTVDQTEENRIAVFNVNEMLNDNLNTLKFRMDAISEITQTIEEAINESECDGTYDASGYL